MTDFGKPLDVTFITRPGCSLCEQAHDLLTHLAHDYPLAVTVLDANEPAGAELAARVGMVFTPGIVIGADVVGSGRVTERHLREEFARRLGLPPPTSGRGAGFRRLRGIRTLVGWLTRSW